MTAPHRLLFRSAKAMGRLRDVVFILAKYGFGELAEALSLRRFRQKRSGTEEPASLATWVKIRRALEELGPTTIKMGQLMSMRPDLIPLELCDELKTLQEDVAPEPYAVIARQVAQTISKPLEEVFSEFDEAPIAAASLSQVHRAVLRRDGRVVAVKVRRPRVRELLLTDLAILEYLAEVAHKRMEGLQSSNLPGLAMEMRKILMREIDFENEARNIMLFNEYFRDNDMVCAPPVVEGLVFHQVLVMDYMPGTRLDAYRGDAESRARIAATGLECSARQMITFGFFHADPHLGNLRVLSDGRLCWYDWGMVGRFTAPMRSSLVDYILAILRRDPAKAARVALDMAVSVPPRLDLQRFELDVMFAMEKVHAPLDGRVNLGRFLIDLISLCREHGIPIRSDYILVARALLVTESSGRAIDPSFDVLEALKPVALKYLARRYSVLFSDKPFFADIEHTLRELAALPERAAKVLRLVESGQFEVRFTQPDLASQMSNIRRIAYIVSAALVASSLVIGSSLIFSSDIGPHWGGLPIFGLMGSILSGIFGIWLVMHIIFRD